MSVVLIVGGGAAGMAAAIAAAGRGRKVHLYEKNEKPGKKLFITGKGRCNVTNACAVETMMDRVVTNPRFLYSSFSAFGNREMMDLLEQCGCPLKIERGERVFPASDKSSDVIRVLERRMRALGVRIHLNRTVRGLRVTEGVCRGIVLERGGRKTDSGGTGREALPEGAGRDREPAGRGGDFAAGGGEEFAAGDAVIVATGGLSYPSTGSTGDGYRMAERCGHTVTRLRPALVPMNVREDDVRELQGLSLRNVEAAVLDGDRELFRETGELLFTRFGVSGPLILSASSYAGRALEKRPLILRIDLKPALTGEQLDARLVRDFAAFANRRFRNSLEKLFPSRLIPVMVRRSGIDPDKPVRDITRKERRRLAELTKNFAFTLTGPRGFDEAVITQGGVSVREICPATMESKKVRGLYFAGEVLDLDAVTGGFNLQIAWSTGWAAGSSVP